MNPTRLFLDTEFTGLHQNAQLISIALVSESGLAFYAELIDFDESQLSDWHRQQVLPNLLLNHAGQPSPFPQTATIRGHSALVRAALMEWLEPFGQVEIWADVLAWDWVLFCQLFGGGFGLPKNVFYIPFDLATLFYLTGNADVSREAFAFPSPEARQAAEAIWPSGHSPKHNALWDALVSRQCFGRLREQLSF